MFLAVSASSTRSEKTCSSYNGQMQNSEVFMMLNKTEKVVPLFTGEIASVKMSASLFLVSTYLIWMLGSKLILSNNQSSANLMSQDTCLIVGPVPFYNHLDYCFVVFENVKQGAEVRKLCV